MNFLTFVSAGERFEALARTIFIIQASRGGVRRAPNVPALDQIATCFLNLLFAIRASPRISTRD